MEINFFGLRWKPQLLLRTVNDLRSRTPDDLPVHAYTLLTIGLAAIAPRTAYRLACLPDPDPHDRGGLFQDIVTRGDDL